MQPGLAAGMIISNEPGFYEDGEFGIRLENLVLVVPAVTPYKFRNQTFLTFETISYAPIQLSLLKRDMLTADDVKWINDYHGKCARILGDELRSQGKLDVLKWLQDNTKPM